MSLPDTVNISPTLIAFILAFSISVIGLALFLLRGGASGDPRCPNCDHPMTMAADNMPYRAVCRACGFKDRRATERRRA